MASINKAILVGRLGQDPEIRQAGTQSVATINLATTEYKQNKDGQRQEYTEWHRVILWGKLAELAGKFLNKGKLVYIEGRIQTRAWEDKTGQKRFTTEIVGQTMQFLSPPSGARDGGSPSEYGSSSPRTRNNDDENIHFDQGFSSGPSANDFAQPSGHSNSSHQAPMFDASQLDDIPF